MAIGTPQVGTPSFETGAGSDSMVASVSGLTINTGDLVFVVGCAESQAAASTPAGFTEWINHGSRLYVWAKIAGGSETNYTVTWATTSAVKSVYVVVVPGNFSATVNDNQDAAPASTGNNSNGNLSYPAFTVAHAGAALLYFGMANTIAWTSVAPIASFTELLDTTTTLGSDQSITCGYQLSATNLSAGNMAITGDAGTGSNQKRCIVVGIYEASAQSNAPRARFCEMLRSV